MTGGDVITEARQWIGTRWQHQASLKGVACDCVGLIRGVYRELTGINIEVPIDYPATWHLFKEEPWLYTECQKYLREIPLQEEKAGDVLVFKMRPRFVAHHCGFLTKEDTLIHAFAEVQKVVEVGYDENWRKWAVAAFRFWEVE